MNERQFRRKLGEERSRRLRDEARLRALDAALDEIGKVETLEEAKAIAADARGYKPIPEKEAA